MPPPRKCIATRAALLLVSLLVWRAACAGPIGVVSDLNGSLLVKRASGSIKVLALKSALEPGDILATLKETYAQVSLTDHSTVTLGPDTELTIEKYSFQEATPQSDASVLRLARGSVRVAAGLVGTRGVDGFTLITPSAALDVRRSTSVVEYVMPAATVIARRNVDPQPQDAFALVWSSDAGAGTYRRVGMRSFGMQTPLPLAFSDSNAGTTAASSAVAPVPAGRLSLVGSYLPPPSSSSGLAPGLYVHVIDGQIALTNRGGTQNFAAGQFGFVASPVQPPVVIPPNPGIQFNPPPSFSSTTSSQTSAPKSGAVDCEVR